ncbi:MAG: hypothetical protein KF799_09795 [Bdellovibrionales bacterium]|nr:hypothetical protein [Bdellovibrionales bacterium]
MIEQSQSVYVSVAHRYWNPQWSAERNSEIYGRNASPEGVGSNLRLTVAIIGANSVDFTESLRFLKNLCDHRCFFRDIPEFQEKPSTLETITLYLGAKLFAEPISDGRWSSLTVAEDDHLACRLKPDSEGVELIERHLNLTCTLQADVDENGVALRRGILPSAVRAIFPQFATPQSESIADWGKRLFAALQIKVKSLRTVDIDLGGQQSLRISSRT